MSIRAAIRSMLTDSTERLFAVPSNAALSVQMAATPPEDVHWEIASPLATHALDELVAAGLATEDGATVSIPWGNIYAALREADRAAALASVGLPAMGNLRPRLRSNNSLDDPQFEIIIEGWLSDAGRTDASRLGAIATTGSGLQLLPEPSFHLANSVAEFWAYPERTPASNRIQWGRIRSLAVLANAGLDEFLAHTIVLTPEKLELRLSDTDVAGSSVVEVEPWFAGAPESWLSHFDRTSGVRDRYQIATNHGLVEVVITERVKSVLSAIKAMPGRRMSGAAAEKFVHNPFAMLGVDAAGVIDEDQFERARYEAGIEFERFTAKLTMAAGTLQDVGVVVERLSAIEGSSLYEKFESPAELRAFIARVETKIQTGFQICDWRRHRLALSGESTAELKLLKMALEEWTRPKISIKALDVLDLKRYSQRISGIGVQPRVLSPYIPTKSGDDPWFPEPPLSPKSTISVSVPLGDDRDLELFVDARVYETLQSAAADARAEGRTAISIPGHPDSVPIETAEAMLDELKATFRPNEGREAILKNEAKRESVSRQRKELLLRANIAQPDFAEERANELRLIANAQPRLPSCLRPGIELKEHQQRGVAWLQNLFDKAPDQCRGAVLADDMGLGKTLQLLTMMCRAFEERPDLDPMLVVAPVSLLENWKEEAEKFFGVGCPQILTLHGSTLQQLRAPRHTIEQELIDQGLAKFLIPDWHSGSQIVLTTYETLRDLEFSIASIRWSMMICDEAQKIKNPATIVTRAAKKQNVGFRIACTGTPVENSLADLWCLFDFVQPGLLGSLNEFGATYRRPIECETEEQRERVRQLRALIEPQILRRTKRDVAKDLPPKIVAEEPRKLAMSTHQRVLYGDALERFKLRNEASQTTPFKNHLALLHYLRRVCIAPETDVTGMRQEKLHAYRKKNPKMNWLMDQLHEIESRSEKAIVFCEFRDVQILLAHYIEREFGFRPDIINGDTETSASATDSRQKRIKKFQSVGGFGVIILSPVAVGFGVNIQAANHVIHFSRTWNPAKEDQATDRAYRIGQTRPVYVYYPVVCAEDFTTFDVKLDRLLERKRALSDDMLNGCGELSPAEFAEVVDIDDRVFDERITADDVEAMKPLLFEALVAVLWRKLGFRYVALTRTTGDGGIDVVAKTVNVGELIQCKTSQSERSSLGWDAIKDVVTGEAKYKFEYPGVTFAKVAVTNQSFSDNARLQAQLNGVRLVDGNALAGLLEKHRVVRGEVDAMLRSRMHISIDVPIQ